jgi:oxygen-dependent protoporphyrinogen oxidase
VSRTVDVAVVGGGIAGLAAARVLHARGASFLVLEGGPRFGGLIRTEEAEGFLLEGGPDAILASKPEGVALCAEVGLAGELVPTSATHRTVWLRWRGRLHPLPEGMVLGVPTRLAPLLRSPLFSWPGKARLALERFVPARAAGAEDESLAAFVRRRLGGEALERVGQPLLAGIHGGKASALSARANFPRLVELERTHGSLTRGLSRGAVTSSFCSLRRGLGTLVEAVVASLPSAALRAGALVKAVSRGAEGFLLEVDGGAPVRAGAVVLAVPAPRAAPVLAGACPEGAAVLGALRFASTATVLLGYARDQVGHALDGYGFVSAAGEGRLTAATFLSTKLPGRAPAGHVLLRAFVGGMADPGALDLDDGALAALAAAELGPLLGLRGRPVLTRVNRWPSAMPQMEVGHQGRVAALERSLAGVPGLVVTGSGLRGTGIPDTVADARRAAEAALVSLRA